MLLQGLSYKKALSPALAALILIGIAIAAMAVTYAWTTSNMQASLPTDVKPYKANLSFQADGKIVINIGNNGASSTQVLNVYVGSSSDDATLQATEPQLPLMLKGDSTARLTISYLWESGKTYYFKILTADAPEPLSFQEQAPQ
jgi:glutamine cyclotransferase